MNSATEELLSYLRTIANFGGTLEQAKALAAKSVDSIATMKNSSIEKDAARYRWLKQNNGGCIWIACEKSQWDEAEPMLEEDADQAIDEEMRKSL